MSVREQSQRAAQLAAETPTGHYFADPAYPLRVYRKTARDDYVPVCPRALTLDTLRATCDYMQAADCQGITDTQQKDVCKMVISACGALKTYNAFE